MQSDRAKRLYYHGNQDAFLTCFLAHPPILISICQDFRRRAKLQNRSSSSSSLIEEPAGMDTALVPSQQPKSQIGFSDLADKHFAISEKLLDEERAKMAGWMRNTSAAFEQEHGNAADPPVEDDDDNEKCDDEVCPAGACCQAVRALRYYDAWMECFKTTLRIARALRKHQGYVPQHPLVTLRPKDSTELGLGDTVWLLPRISFRPYDCCILRLTVESVNPCIAAMVTNCDGLPNVVPLQAQLREISDRCSPQDFVMVVLTYSGSNFGKVEILSVENLEDAANKSTKAGEPAALDSEEEQEQKEMKARADLLRKALNASADTKPDKPKKPVKKPVNQRKTNKAKGKSKGKDARPQDELPAVQDAEFEQDDPEEPGLAGQMHRELEQSWNEALDEELPKPPASSASGSSTSAVATGATSPAVTGGNASVPETIPEKPWKDSKGNVFLPRDGKPYAVHLGVGLGSSMISISAKAAKVFIIHLVSGGYHYYYY